MFTGKEVSNKNKEKITVEMVLETHTREFNDESH